MALKQFEIVPIKRNVINALIIQIFATKAIFRNESWNPILNYLQCQEWIMHCPRSPGMSLLNHTGAIKLAHNQGCSWNTKSSVPATPPPHPLPIFSPRFSSTPLFPMSSIYHSVAWWLSQPPRSGALMQSHCLHRAILYWCIAGAGSVLGFANVLFSIIVYPLAPSASRLWVQITWSGWRESI